MAGRVVLHIGAMKTGTSYLQSVLGSNTQALEDAGFTFLGGKFGQQALAVRNVLNLPKTPRKNKVRWAALAQEAHKLDGRTGIVSMEFLSFAGPRHVRAFLEPLEGLEVEVIVTVRDQFRVIRRSGRPTPATTAPTTGRHFSDGSSRRRWPARSRAPSRPSTVPRTCCRLSSAGAPRARSP